MATPFAFFSAPHSWTELRHAIELIPNYVITEPRDRIPITLYTVPYTSIPLLSMLFMAYLARRPGTWHLRLAFAPVALVATLRVAFGYVWVNQFAGAFNFQSGLVGVYGAAKVIEWAMVREGVLKIGEIEPGRIETPAIDLDRAVKPSGGAIDTTVQVSQRISHKANGNGLAIDHPSTPSSHSTFLGGLQDGLELLCAMRGIGWKYGTGAGLYIPPEWKDTTNRSKWCRQTFWTFAWYFFIADFMESFVKLYPGPGSAQGGSIFAFGSNPMEKYAHSTALQFATGMGILSGFYFVSNLTALICVLFLGHDPVSWPPLMESPWSSISLHDFWAKRWHQTLRQTFLIIGGFPLGTFLGPVGYVVGTFLASGLFHSWALYAMGKGTDAHCVIFFTAQSLGLIAERLWRRATGKRVGGWFGTLWTWSWILGGGQWCINAWHLRGFAGGTMIPVIFSPTRLVVFPLALRLYDAIR